MARASNLNDEELTFILNFVKKQDGKGILRSHTYKVLGQKLERDPDSIARAIQRLMPTVTLARARFQAGAAKMAKRVIAKGSVQDLIDVLSRPSVGVLDPAIKAGAGGQGGGFLTSVTVESIGASRTTITTAPDVPQLGQGSNVIDVESERADADDFIPISNNTPPAKPESRFERNVRLNREKLAAARLSPTSNVARIEKGLPPHPLAKSADL